MMVGLAREEVFYEFSLVATIKEGTLVLVILRYHVKSFRKLFLKICTMSVR